MKERERYLERALDNGTAASAEVFPEAAEIAAAHAALLAKVDADEMTLEQAEAEWGKVMAGYADYSRRVSEVYDELHDLREAEIFAAEKKRRAEKAAAVLLFIVSVKRQGYCSHGLSCTKKAAAKHR